MRSSVGRTIPSIVPSKHLDASAIATKTCGKQPTSTPILSSTVNIAPNMIPAAQMNSSKQRIFITIPKSTGERTHFYIQLNNNPRKVSLTNLGKRPKLKVSGGVPQNGKDAPQVPSPSSSTNSPVNGTIDSSSLMNSTSTPTAKSRYELMYLKPKPKIPMPFLIALALKNSHNGYLLTAEICNFISEHFPYYRTASEDWKHNTRNHLSSSKYFRKIYRKNISDGRSKYSWKMNPSKINQMDLKLQLLLEQPTLIGSAMDVPKNFAALLRGELKHGSILPYWTTPTTLNRLTRPSMAMQQLSKP